MAKLERELYILNEKVGIYEDATMKRLANEKLIKLKIGLEKDLAVIDNISKKKEPQP